MMMMMIQDVEYQAAYEREKRRERGHAVQKDEKYQRKFKYLTKSWTMNSPGFELDRSDTG
jgi:hypothetical protein